MSESQTIKNMTGREIIDALQADTPLAKVRAIFSQRSAQIEQAQAQRTPLSPIEMRRMELQAANAVLALFGLALP